MKVLEFHHRTLGAENIRRSLVAALSGLALVAVFMVVAYRLPGVWLCWL